MGVAEIQKMSPSKTGRCSRRGSGDSRQMGVWHGDMAANHTDLLYLTSRRGWKNYIRRPDMVERIGSYLPSEFPLFHGRNSEVCFMVKRFLSVPWVHQTQPLQSLY